MKRFFRLILISMIFVLFCLIFSSLAWADGIICGTWGYLTWEIDTDGCLTISGKGSMDNFENDSSDAWREYKSRINSVVIGNGITSIGDNAFCDCYSINSVLLPESLTWIGDSSFSHCYRLGNIIIPSNVTSIGLSAFFSCENLLSIEIPDGVTKISGSAFAGCKRLHTVQLPDSVSSIDLWAFGNCSALKNITIPTGVTVIGDHAFANCKSIRSVTIPAGVTKVDFCAFQECDGLYSVTIPASVKNFETYAFEGCDKLTTAGPIGSGCTIEFGWNDAIPDNVFGRCSFLSRITIPEGLSSVGEEAFIGCVSLEEIEFPESVTSIGRSAFSGCTNMSEIRFLSSSINIGISAFQGCTFLKSLGPVGSNTNIEVGEQSEISDWAFVSSSLESAIIPSGVSCIGEGAFSGSNNLLSVVIPASVLQIKGGAFSGCRKLNDIYYTGTQSQWESLMLNGNADTNIYRANIHYISGVCGAQGSNIVWTLRDDGELLVEGEGRMMDYEEGSAPWYRSRQSISSVVIGRGVTYIGNYAFYYCDHVLSLSLADGVAEIGLHAFDSCTALPAVEFPSSIVKIGMHSFAQCDYLGSISIVEGLTNISSWAFYSCDRLTSITVPASVCSIGDNAFLACRDLVEITVNPDNARYYDVDGVLFDRSIKTILHYPAAKTDISYTMPDGVEKIGQNSFHSCRYLEVVVLPEGILSIENGAFQGCFKLATIIIPKSMSIINAYAFSVCRKLADVYFLGVEEEWDNILIKANNESLYNAVLHCVTPDLVLPDSLVTIEDEAFFGGSFVYVKLPDGVKSIGSFAFSGCPNLKYVYIPATIMEIDQFAFDGVAGLTIIGKADSAAKTYAASHNYKFIVIESSAPMVGSSHVVYK